LSAGIVRFDIFTLPVNLAERGPPLSLSNTTRVFSRILRFSRAPSTRPISASMAAIMAA
jgi:hypothetical protein